MIRADLTNLLITRSADEIPTDEVARDQFHTLMVSSSMGETGFRFSSRLAMYDFARSLLHESIYGRSGLKEFYPLEEFDGRRLAIDGVRLSAGSGRVFITYLTDRAYDISPSININDICDSLLQGRKWLSGEYCFRVSLEGGGEHADVCLDFNLQDALYDFARGILRESVFGRSGVYCFGSGDNGCMLRNKVETNAVSSMRLCIYYPAEASVVRKKATSSAHTDARKV